jgi:RNA binding exosome subunit
MLSRLLEQARGANRDQILTALEESQHQVMSLYARLERQQARRESSNRGIE